MRTAKHGSFCTKITTCWVLMVWVRLSSWGWKNCILSNNTFDFFKDCLEPIDKTHFYWNVFQSIISLTGFVVFRYWRTWFIKHTQTFWFLWVTISKCFFHTNLVFCPRKEIQNWSRYVSLCYLNKRFFCILWYTGYDLLNSKPFTNRFRIFIPLFFACFFAVCVEI